jgi:hypothetical protein
MAYETRTGMHLEGGCGLSGKNHGKHAGIYGTHAGFMGALAHSQRVPT